MEVLPPDSAPWASRKIDPSLGGRRSRVEFVPLDDVAVGLGGGRPTGNPEMTLPAGGRPAPDDGFRYQLWDDLEA